MVSTIGRLANKSGVIFGYASTRSIAWSIAEAWYNEGAQITISIANERFRSSLEKATETWSRKPQIILCDVTNDQHITEAGPRIAEHHQGKVNFLAHSIAYAPAHAMKASFLETTRDDYLVAHSISTYSLIALTRELYPYMKLSSSSSSSATSTPTTMDNPASSATDSSTRPSITNSIIALSYIGAQRASTGYRIMSTAKASLESTVRSLALDLGQDGIRVNTISAGPIDTLASRGIQGFTNMKDGSIQRAPLKYSLKGKDVGNLATFLASSESSMITGQTIYVDGGFSAVL